MASPSIDLRELAQEDHAPAEQILANALQFYAALPAEARQASLAAMRSADPAAHTRLVRELVRTVLKVQLEEQRDQMLRAAHGGELPPEAPLELEADEAYGQETMNLIRHAREQRTTRFRR